MATTKTMRETGSIVKDKKQGMWERAIVFLEAQLPDATEQRAAQIRNAINTFEANSKRGMPWPGKSATQS